MHNKLQEILEKTKKDLANRKQLIPLEILKKSIVNNPQRSLKESLKNPKTGRFALIAEIKLASPTEGDLGLQRDIIKRVKEYELAGADAISYVAEKHFFKGNISFISKIKSSISLPILLKDFILDEYQVYEAKKYNADALLLLAKILDKNTLSQSVLLVKELGMEPIVEIDNINDIEKAVFAKPSIIAVNARDLDTFIVDRERACDILKQIPNNFLKLGFSGIYSYKEVEKYGKAGAKGMLIGTSLMKAKNVEEFIFSLKL